MPPAESVQKKYWFTSLPEPTLLLMGQVLVSAVLLPLVMAPPE